MIFWLINELYFVFYILYSYFLLIKCTPYFFITIPSLAVNAEEPATHAIMASPRKIYPIVMSPETIEI